MSTAFLSSSFSPSFRNNSIQKNNYVSTFRKRFSSPLHSSSVKMLTRIPDGSVTSPKGFKAAGHTAGFKASGQPDLALVTTSDMKPVPTAAVFTTNLVRAAPVTISESHMQRSGGRIAGVLLNAGQANAATGEGGLQDGLHSAMLVADALSVSTHNIFICSTGVIGHRFDMSKMSKAIPQIVNNLSESTAHGIEAATSIITTDLIKKHVAFSDVIDGNVVTIGGMCKGSGMIHPSMATMLAVITCDAHFDDQNTDVWRSMLQQAVDKSFNAITVDGDTSTNDVVCALAGGQSGLSVTDENMQKLQHLLDTTCVYLAKAVARDGEGATVLLEVQVSGAGTQKEAMSIAKTVASSSLVKSAVFGRDPNWGRIAAAAGRANVSFDLKKLSISIGEYTLMENGAPLDKYAKEASQYMKDKANASEADYLSEKDTVVISLSVGEGPGSATAWGCDLSYKYVEINAEYTT